MFKPMLASATDGTSLRYPLLASPKLDGVRCLIIDGVAMSRSLKPIPNKHVQKLFGRKELNGLDGELIIGEPTHEDCYRTTVSGVMSVEGEPKIQYFIFDDLRHPAGFHERLKHAAERLRLLPAGGGRLKLVGHEILSSDIQLQALEEAYVSQGYEGIMLRDPQGPYKRGRSTLKEGWLRKLKRFEDGEAEILGFQEQMHNANEAETGELGQTKRSHKKAGMVATGTLGALLVSDTKTGVEFSIGTGFSARDRDDFWKARTTLKGRLVKYKFQPTGVKTAPRFPVFLGFRDLIDL